jgi:thiol-disulfide isomerase/thioredoxin
VVKDGWRRFSGFAALLVFIGLGSFGVGNGAQPADRIAGFEGGNGWLNGPELTPAGLQGRVVLVDFWEYTCINCLRTLPYLREWYRRYHDRGFVIVGVHTPEFDFSGVRANVAAAAKRLGVVWPVVLDDRLAIWKRYGNDVWPHEYLYDQSGKLVEDFAGEGGYPQTEARIQTLLKRGDAQLALPPTMPLLPEDSYDKPGAVCYPKTPELLVGREPVANASAFNNPAQDSNYVDGTSDPHDGAIYLQGFWHLTSEAAVSGGNDGYLALRYHAIQVVAVMKPENGAQVRVDVTQDGAPVAKSDAGNDLRYDPEGRSYVSVDSPRAYDIVVNARFGEHRLKLSPRAYGLGIYDFAFESCAVSPK